MTNGKWKMTNGKWQMANNSLSTSAESNIESDMNHIPVVHNVVLPFQSEFALLAATSFAAELGEVFESSNFSSYEPALDVRVNHSSRLVRGGPALDRPGAAFVFARRQEADQVEQRICGANESVARGFCDAQILEKLALLFGRKLRYFHLDLAGHRDGAELLRFSKFVDFGRHAVSHRILWLVQQQ